VISYWISINNLLSVHTTSTQAQVRLTKELLIEAVVLSTQADVPIAVLVQAASINDAINLTLLDAI